MYDFDRPEPVRQATRAFPILLTADSTAREEYGCSGLEKGSRGATLMFSKSCSSTKFNKILNFSASRGDIS